MEQDFVVREIVGRDTGRRVEGTDKENSIIYFVIGQK